MPMVVVVVVAVVVVVVVDGDILLTIFPSSNTLKAATKCINVILHSVS